MQPDFLEQSTALEELHGEARDKCYMLPKCHPELNPIESFWAAMKEFCRQHCDYSIAGLKKMVPKALGAVPIAQIRRYFRRSNRFSSLYREEKVGAGAMPFPLRAFIMKKYARHRGVPKLVLDALDRDLKGKVQKYEERKTRISSEHNEKRLRDAHKLLGYLQKYQAQLESTPRRDYMDLTSYWPNDSDPGAT